MAGDYFHNRMQMQQQIGSILRKHEQTNKELSPQRIRNFHSPSSNQWQQPCSSASATRRSPPRYTGNQWFSPDWSQWKMNGIMTASLTRPNWHQRPSIFGQPSFFEAPAYQPQNAARTRSIGTQTSPRPSLPVLEPSIPGSNRTISPLKPLQTIWPSPLPASRIVTDCRLPTPCSSEDTDGFLDQPDTCGLTQSDKIRLVCTTAKVRMAADELEEALRQFNAWKQQAKLAKELDKITNGSTRESPTIATAAPLSNSLRSPSISINGHQHQQLSRSKTPSPKSPLALPLSSHRRTRGTKRHHHHATFFTMGTPAPATEESDTEINSPRSTGSPIKRRPKKLRISNLQTPKQEEETELAVLPVFHCALRNDRCTTATVTRMKTKEQKPTSTPKRKIPRPFPAPVSVSAAFGREDGGGGGVDVGGEDESDGGSDGEWGIRPTLYVRNCTFPSSGGGGGFGGYEDDQEGLTRCSSLSAF